MLTFEHVRFEYRPGTPVLTGVHISFTPGERILLAGRNGAGKSTVLRLANGLLRPTDGRVIVEGEDTAHQPVSRMARHVSVTFQRPGDQLTESSVGDELRLSAELARREDASSAVDRALAVSGLHSVRHRHPYDLEPAERRLLVVASALATGAPYAFLDEPTAGLGQRELGHLASMLEEFHSSSRTVVMVAHDPATVWPWIDRAVVISEGRISLDSKRTDQLSVGRILEAAGMRASPAAAAFEALGKR